MKNKPKIPPVFIVLSLIPPLHIGLVGYAAVRLLLETNWTNGLVLAGAVYALPVLLYRLISLFKPIPTGLGYLDEGNTWPWLAAIKLQMLFISFPALEQILILIPGAFSLWLRLWGSKIGRGVLWAPHTEISDRTHLEISDLVVFGHRTYLACHAIKIRRNRPLLYFERIRIGTEVFIGAGTTMGPGVVIGDGVHLPVLTHLYPNEKVIETPKQSAASSAGNPEKV